MKSWIKISLLKFIFRYITLSGFILLLLPSLSSEQYLYAQEHIKNPDKQLQNLYLNPGIGFNGLGFGYQFEFSAQYKFGVLSLRYLNFREFLNDPNDSMGEFALMYGFRDHKEHTWAAVNIGVGVTQFTDRECTEYEDDGSWLFRDCISHTSEANRGIGLAYNASVGYRFISLNIVGNVGKENSFVGFILGFNMTINLQN